MRHTTRLLCTMVLALSFIMAGSVLSQERIKQQDKPGQTDPMNQQDDQYQQDTKSQKSKSSGAVTPRGMATRYIIVTEHTEAECAEMMDKMADDNKQALNNTWFGCMTGDHTGYTIVDAKDEKTALNLLPQEERTDAKIVKVNKFTPDMIKAMHKTDSKNKSRGNTGDDGK